MLSLILNGLAFRIILSSIVSTRLSPSASISKNSIEKAGIAKWSENPKVNISLIIIVVVLAFLIVSLITVVL